MSLIARFDGNMNVISKLLKEYRMKENMSYETLSAKLELMGISIHKQSMILKTIKELSKIMNYLV